MHDRDVGPILHSSPLHIQHAQKVCIYIYIHVHTSRDRKMQRQRDRQIKDRQTDKQTHTHTLIDGSEIGLLSHTTQCTCRNFVGGYLHVHVHCMYMYMSLLKMANLPEQLVTAIGTCTSTHIRLCTCIYMYMYIMYIRVLRLIQLS